MNSKLFDIGEKVKAEVAAFKKKLLDEALAECSEGERDTFRRLYPNGLRPDQMDWAITQCRYAAQKHKEKNS